MTCDHPGLSATSSRRGGRFRHCSHRRLVGAQRRPKVSDSDRADGVALGAFCRKNRTWVVVDLQRLMGEPTSEISDLEIERR